jgi:hypothetical protein
LGALVEAPILETLPKDAIHVAGALVVEAPILETFDGPLLKKSGKVGNPPLVIREPPPPEKPRLPGI